MSTEDYEWLVAVALNLHALTKPKSGGDQVGTPRMQRIDGVVGILEPNDWAPSNDGGFSTACAVIAWLLLVANMHKPAPAAFLAKFLHSSCRIRSKTLYKQLIRHYFFAFS